MFPLDQGISANAWLLGVLSLGVCLPQRGQPAAGTQGFWVKQRWKGKGGKERKWEEEISEETSRQMGFMVFRDGSSQ